MGDIVFVSDTTFEMEEVELESIDTEQLYPINAFETANWERAIEEFTVSAEDIVDELERHGRNNESDEVSFLDEGSFLVISE